MDSNIKKINLINLAVTVLPFCILPVLFGYHPYTPEMGAFLLFSLVVVVASRKEGYKKSFFEGNFFGLLLLVVSILHSLFLFTAVYNEFVGLGVAFLYITLAAFVFVPTLSMVLLRSYYQVFKNSNTNFPLKISLFSGILFSIVSFVGKSFWIHIPLDKYINFLPEMLYIFAQKNYYPVSNIESILILLVNLVVISVTLFGVVSVLVKGVKLSRLQDKP